VTSRREFPNKVRIAAFERAKGHCEKCTARLVVGKFAYDHVIADALGGEPTLGNCAVLCDSCHGEKTPGDKTAAAKVKRTTRKLVAGIKKPSTFRKPRELPGYRYDSWRKVYVKETAT
jgi:5-methylcytosine-specific restriction protein A